ncbi:MAG: DUF4276 family protein [Acidobacteria bacterium]|nr:DUF4276 family protein [Acidobacteriota bacterium]
MREIVFCLEEESARVLLDGLMKRLLPEGCEMAWSCIVFEGKQDLDKQLERKLRHYLNPKARFLVLRDQDQADCRRLKTALARKCTNAGRGNAIVRIACREIESFFLGDLKAVELGLEVRNLSRRQAQARFRNPDQFGAPAEEIARLSGRRYQKVSGARAIAPHLALESNRSPSFRCLLRSIRSAIDELCAP